MKTHILELADRDFKILLKMFNDMNKLIDMMTEEDDLAQQLNQCEVTDYYRIEDQSTKY